MTNYFEKKARYYAEDSLMMYYRVNGIPKDYEKTLHELLDEDDNLADLLKLYENALRCSSQAEDDLDNYLDEKTQALKEFIYEEKKGMVLTEDEDC